MSTTNVAPRSKHWSPDASIDTARVLRLLMAKPWLCAGRDDEDIATVRRNADAVRDVFARLGWSVVIESDLVRLRKSPPVRLDAYAKSGYPPLTCQWLFLLVAGAETLGRHVLLGQLVAAARSAAAEADVENLGDIVERRAIVAALRMLDERGVIVTRDGEVERFVDDEEVAVLLEVHHTRLLHVIANYADVNPVEDPVGWLDAVERSSSTAVAMRRRLVDDTISYACDHSEAEADWLSRRLRDDGEPLAEAFGLHVERRSEGAAFVVPEDAFRHGWQLGPLRFPAGGTVAHAALLVCDWARREHEVADTPGAGWRLVEAEAVADRLAALAEEQSTGSGGWKQELQADPRGRLLGEVRVLLTGLDLVRPIGGDRWAFSPAIERWEAPVLAPRSRPEQRRTNGIEDNDAD